MDEQRWVDAGRWAERAAEAAEAFLANDVGFQDPSLFSTMKSLIQMTRRWEQGKAMVLGAGVVPVGQLRAEARELVEVRTALEGTPPSEEAEQREFLNVLTEWFKVSFFRWVDSPTCDYCAGATVLEAQVPPNEEERGFLASRTEAYRCNRCGNITRFPRYNDPVKLLETRRGRCGEWANGFGAVATALGIRTRAVQDFADHVWNECLVAGRWIHVDPCEGIVDRPMLYESGWGKAVRRVVGADPLGVRDCTKRYSRKAEEDVMFGICCDAYTRYMREGLTGEELASLRRIDEDEEADMETVREVPGEVLPGRTTGSAAWRQQRGEVGNGETASVCTRYRVVRFSEGAPLAGMRCASRASGENAPGETSDKAFDGRVVSKWLCFEKDGAWLELRLLDEEVSIASYSLTSANDEPCRDPADWRVEMRGEDGEWVIVDRRKNIEFGSRGDTKAFEVRPGSLRMGKEIRLVIERVRAPAEANSVQISRFDIVPGTRK